MSVDFKYIKSDYRNISFEDEIIPPLESKSKFINPEHKLIKELKRHLEKKEWKEAFKIYKNDLSQETRQTVHMFVCERTSSLSFFKHVNLTTIEKFIDYCFTCENENQMEMSHNFLKFSFLPSLQQILIKSYEFEKADRNRQEADKAFHHVRGQLFSPNYPTRDDALQNWIIEQFGAFDANLYLFKISQLKNELASNRMSLRWYFSNTPVINSCNFLKEISSVQIVKDTFLGNCEEIAFFGLYNFILNNELFKNAEVFKIFNGDHAFVVLNRKKDSDPRDFTTWGTHCLIADYWKKDGPYIFPATEIPQHLYNYEGMDQATTKLRKFNPFSDQLQNVSSAVYSPKDFQDSLDFTLSEEVDSLTSLVSKLTAFHLAGTDKKRVIALEIIADHPKHLSKTNRPIVKNLIAQMRCFVNPHYADIFNIGPKIIHFPFDDKQIDTQFFENYVSSITISHLLKIADLLMNDQENKGIEKFNNLDSRLHDPIREKLMELQENYQNEEYSESSLLANAIYSWIAEKYAIAKDNGKTNEAEKIFNLLPAGVQEML